MDWIDLGVLGAVVAGFVLLWFLRKRRVNFSLITLLALLVGIPLGLLAQGYAAYIEPIGKIYINILLAAMAPLVVLSIISSITSLGSIAQLKSIGVRSIFWLLASNGLGVALALGLALTFEIGTGVGETLGGEELSVLKNSVQNFGDVIVSFFPSNIVSDVAGNHIIPLIIIAVTISIAYLSLSERRGKEVKGFRDNVESLNLFKAKTPVVEDWGVRG